MKSLEWRWYFMVISTVMAMSKTSASVISICPQCSYVDIKSGLAAAEPMDTLQIEEGSYVGSRILIDKSLTIQGKGEAVIDGNGEPIFIVTADFVTIRDLTFKNVETSYIEDKAAIRIREAKHFLIQGNTLIHTFFGIYLEHSDSGIVMGNVLMGDAVEEMSSGNGIHAWYSNSLTIHDNTVENHRDGIYLEFVENSTVDGNTCKDNLRYGLHFMFSNYDSYQNNRFERNGAGVAVMFSKNILMRKKLLWQQLGFCIIRIAAQGDIRCRDYRQYLSGKHNCHLH